MSESTDETHLDKLLRYTKALGDHVANGQQLAGAVREELNALTHVTMDLQLYKECGDLMQSFEAFMKLWNERSEKLRPKDYYGS
jgi:hypothetical protein